MSQRKTVSLAALEGELLPEEETYQARLRQAIYDGVSESDVADVIKQITAKAKAGDPQAQKLFFDYVLGGKTSPTSITVNNHFPDVETAARARSRKTG